MEIIKNNKPHIRPYGQIDNDLMVGDKNIIVDKNTNKIFF